MTFILALCIAASVVYGTTAVGAQPAVDGPKQTLGATSVSSCSALAKADFAHTREAPATIVTATAVEASRGVPGYCEVHGVVLPNVGFTLKLPQSTWNGRFFEAGCGGYCGIDFDPKACDAPLQRGFACIVTDAGHVARPGSVGWAQGTWAVGNLEAQLDYGGRASHVTAIIGKAITRSYYGRGAAKSYFMGCSYGGHQAMVLAQRYPWDFDGIVGGGVPNNIGILMQQNLWALRYGFDSHLKSVFSQADLRVLHNAVLARCDKDDGVKDGLIGNPLACKIDPDKLVCKAGKTRECLSQATADAAKKMYSGPTDSRGTAITAGGWMPGSELYWGVIYSGPRAALALMAVNYFRYLDGVPAAGGPRWSATDYDFDTDYKRNDVIETLYAADNPDLGRFKKAGGKLIMYVGWNDLGALPENAIDYYETSERTMGGAAATQDFFRMYAIPGALHCRGGDGADSIDFLSYIEAWVEQDHSPDVMLGSHRDSSGKVVFTRPVYPYPLYAKYRGSGDPNDAANFKPVAPHPSR